MGHVSETEHITDGRRRKGEQRRRLLLNATMRIIEREGVAAVSQRRVAAEAEVPPSAVTYYYAAVDDLLVDALTRVNDTYVAAIAALPDDPDDALRGFAALVATGSDADRAHVMAECELFLIAARRPSMRTQIRRWNQAVDAFLAPYLPDPVARAGAAAAIDGLFLRCCTVEPAPKVDEVQAVLSRLVSPGSAPEPRTGPGASR
ncbi:TetR/AcrR family transcriptional regulator [Nocardiopsis lucentensis]|uniref:TetR/AcrR family transcriptional regulator n=1 Tax=Nocardiopsis lucentensis TaxID=53441 RepID=UPI0003773743|nr:TetR family transcriptional regulator [Nocardiopsis lucentensis]